jgi:ribokinase
MQPRLVCLGNLTVDDLYLPDGSTRPGCVGGDAFYAALGARLWEPRTAMFAPVGADLPKASHAAIERSGFDASVLPRRKASTIRNQVHYGADGSRHWVYEFSPDAFQELSVMPADIPDWILGAEAILISAMSLEAQEACVEFLRRRSQALLVLDLQEEYIPANQQRILDIVARVDMFLPSEEEARRLSGREDWEYVAKMFADVGPEIVAIKLAERGALLYDRSADSYVRASARQVAVVDPTGAGDGWCGGFVAGYLQDPTDLPRAARCGAISAAFAVSGYGTDGLLNATTEAAARALDSRDGWLPAYSVGATSQPA